ncbi:MAG TPA: glutathione S-transferase family protein [Cyanobacteria bacterium UBA11149]|nr:glutathione S-transferase family protein [Cyanobacteria bacterium UBA11367]HBE58940.1 glutathione S-transferase family protein [Cyanobacteria bacterium UBA11366]HBK66781.1 glutathione S-transferase family protein [Cyanobacteria bacterium UBA11166]HBR73368.1 glutathione S-transferase family protein [Cyanobacteria bacterium UBA11159]HBS72172.1 glutathione S-transferase family protein [Cyanobacteria bacterium UBA11153]HBW88218.1 glutathione S-transferase family protein [Cyanobacteria bacterium
MIKLYHTPVSPNSRRVWVTLLEKGLEFELVEVKLDGEQFKPEFLQINPFHHVPTLVDDNFNLVESLAILDYLDAKYPKPKMLPTDAKDLGIVRMVELVTVNELLPNLTTLSPVILGLPGANPEKIDQAKTKIAVVLKFFESLLDNRPFFGSENITLAEPVAGTVIPWLAGADVSLKDYPKLSAWCDRIQSRVAWQNTAPTPADMEMMKSVIRARLNN